MCIKLLIKMKKKYPWLIFMMNKACIEKPTSSWLPLFTNVVGKSENTGHQHFLLFPQ